MTQMEWDFLPPREPDWRANWSEVTPELRDRLARLNHHQSEGSVAQGWLGRYEHERTRIGLDTPPSYPGDRLWGTSESGGQPLGTHFWLHWK